MGINWSEALAGGVAAGAGAIQYQQQQDQENQRWLDREKQLMAMQAQSQLQKERYLLALEPPKVDKQVVTGDNGRPMVQNRQWVAPSDADIAAGTPGHFEVTSTENVPRKLGQRSYQSGANEVTELYDTDTGETVRTMGAGPKWNPEQTAIDKQRLGIEAGRLALDRSKAAQDKSDTGKDWQVETQMNPDGTGSYVRVNKRTGEVQPLTLGNKPLTTFRGGEGLSQAYQDAQKAAQDEADAANEAIDDANRPGLLARAYNYVTGHGDYNAPQAGPPASLAGGSAPMGQFAGPQATTSPQAPQGGQSPYQEGQVIYDRQGRAYRVQNGQPVPI